MMKVLKVMAEANGIQTVQVATERERIYDDNGNSIWGYKGVNPMYLIKDNFVAFNIFAEKLGAKILFDNKRDALKQKKAIYEAFLAAGKAEKAIALMDTVFDKEKLASVLVYTGCDTVSIIRTEKGIISTHHYPSSIQGVLDNLQENCSVEAYGYGIFRRRLTVNEDMSKKLKCINICDALCHR